MGFCRRCGDIVNGNRCDKCYGSVVAPTVSWNQNTPQEDLDKWSKTYVSREVPAPPPRPKSRGTLESPLTSSTSSALSSAKHFPRAFCAQITGSAALDNRITNHIASSASQSLRSTSPIKPTVTGPKPESGILPSLIPNDTSLSKVYGSVLQPKDTLATHSCATCATPFLPDATIYPDPSLSPSDEPSFLCRQCFIVGGGSKGFCPNCDKPVTILKSEGGFVYAADKYWHKKCFNCEGCSRNIGESPMVDLLGRPSCPECFDTCLSRESRTPNRAVEKPAKPASIPERRSIGGPWELPSVSPNKFRESSPTLEELEQRLGISKSREGSPAIEELGQRLSSIGREYHPRYSSPSSPLQARSSRFEGSPSPVRRLERFQTPELDDPGDGGSHSFFGGPRRESGSPAPTTEAIEEMKNRFLRQATVSPAGSTVTLLESSPNMPVSPLRLPNSATSPKSSLDSKAVLPLSRVDLSSPASSPPDFMSDFSDTLTQSSLSGLDSPPRVAESLFGQSSRYNRTDLLSDPKDIIVEETKSQLNTPDRTPQSTMKLRSNTISNTPIQTPTKISSTITKGTGSAAASSACALCEKPLFAIKDGGKFVTVPAENDSDAPQTFHKNCFRCTICHGVFDETANGQAIFVRSNAGPAHVECAPLEKIVIRKSPSAGSLRFSHERVAFKDTSPAKIPTPSQRSAGYHTSSRFERPSATPSTTTPFSRFGSRTVCPGCNKSVSPMERGVIPGPQGSRWHADCLVCGGKRPPSKSNSWILGRGEEKRQEPGCGKKLDSAAKSDSEGRIWCRQCLLMLGVGGSPQTSPTRTPATPTSGTNGKVPQLSGTTTIARQFTGLGGGIGAGEVDILRQLTGGSISPTRSLSPTKQLGTTMRPRPKSVIGMRNSKSVDEGRGMFLVRQLTGASSNHWEES